MHYTAFVDESGDVGIQKVRSSDSPGSSQYFVMGAAVFQSASEIHARSVLSNFRDVIGKKQWKHATDLGHPEKVYLVRCLGALPARYFAVISNKHTLDEYKRDIGFDPQKFYNKCTKYLLELILAYLLRRGVSGNSLQVILERRNHDYDMMLRYLEAVKAKPLYAQSRIFESFNPFSISTRIKGEEDLLEVADFVSYSVYQLTNRSEKNYGIPEKAYFTEISSRFAGDERQNVLGAGIKCIHSLEQLQLVPEVVRLLNTSKCKAPSGGKR